jgi:hypothetical protein
MDTSQPFWRRQHGLSRFTRGSPLAYSKGLAESFGFDLAVPNGPGLGNIIIYSRLVEDLSWHHRRPISLLSCPMRLAVGVDPDESPYPVWENNPFVRAIVDPVGKDQSAEKNLLCDKDDLCQFSHITENLCNAYGIPNRANHGAVYLTASEMAWALDKLSYLPRPIVCIHPSGKSSSPQRSPWFVDNWLHLQDSLFSRCSIFRVALPSFDTKKLDIPFFKTTVRQMMALIWASDVFIGFDSGPGHVAAAFRKPSIILWDVLQKRMLEQAKEPGFETAMLVRWAYPQNDNVLIYGERDNETLQVVEKLLLRRLYLLDGKS